MGGVGKKRIEITDILFPVPDGGIARRSNGDGAQGRVSDERKRRALMMIGRLLESDQAGLIEAVIDVFYERAVRRGEALKR